MRTNKKVYLIILIMVFLGAGMYFLTVRHKKTPDETVNEITPTRGTISKVISCTGTVLPKNRLEVKPPVNGRIEKLLVKEGDTVTAGEILAWMSSTERAALLDAARGKGDEALEYWQETYKPIPLSAPIDAEVIVATTQPGQTVTSTDAVVVLSDRLIVRAQVDETDIGKIALAMDALISLDAYPDVKIKAHVVHIYYESKTINNVTMYEVDLLPDEIPNFFRSGMNATVDFIEQSKDDVLLVPVDAVLREKGEAFVLLVRKDIKEPIKTKVELGITDDRNVEIISGISSQDTIISRTKKYSLPTKTGTGTNPFMPFRR